MVEKIEHIGIAVADEQEAVALFTRLLGREPYQTEIVATEGVKTIFFQVGETKIELLIATNEDSPIAKYLSKRGPGIHHIAFGVDNLREEMQRMADAGFEPLQSEPRRGADQKQVGFFHPKGTNGVLIEFCEDNETAQKAQS